LLPKIVLGYQPDSAKHVPSVKFLAALESAGDSVSGAVTPANIWHVVVSRHWVGEKSHLILLQTV
jgi:hypothetical protein